MKEVLRKVWKVGIRHGLIDSRLRRRGRTLKH